VKRFSKFSDMYVLYFLLLHSWQTAMHILRSMRWPPTEPRTVTHVRDHWLTLDFATAFVSPDVNGWPELVPSPRAYARNGAPRRWLGDEVACVAGPQVYGRGGLFAAGRILAGTGEEFRACRKAHLSWLHVVQILNGEYDRLIGQYH
jgi:hypothetical protein